jgi:hypothetical protein
VIAPLLGKNLVRLVYLDEAGTDRKSPNMCVAGVILHGDSQWPEVDRRILSLIEKHIPEEDRPGFVFHATDIFHGSGYFDRKKPEWADRDKRTAILNDLAAIIYELGLPVVAGLYTKDRFAEGVVQLGEDKIKAELMHASAATDCLIRADKWLARYFPDELATVIHEDGSPSKHFIKRVVRILRDPEQIRGMGWDSGSAALDLPLRRIIDTVHFAEKPDARPLQLADLCAFLFSRAMKEASVPEYAFKLVNRVFYLTVKHDQSFPEALRAEGQPS